MADDLDNFFAKKALKKNKKIIAQDTDSLAKRLEKAVRQQEQIDRDKEEEERVLKERQQAVESQQTVDEDSEWLDVQQEVEINLGAGTGLQELNIEEIEEDNKSVNEERNEKPKTWNLAQSKEDVKQAAAETDVVVDEDNNKKTPSPPPPSAPQQPAKYVPPSLRNPQPSSGNKSSSNAAVEPNIQDASEFPSLMAADTISKKELEYKKLKAQKDKEMIEREKEWAAKRQREKAAVELEEQQKRERQEQQDKIEAEEKEKQPPSAPAPPKYVPPHLRKAQPC